MSDSSGCFNLFKNSFNRSNTFFLCVHRYKCPFFVNHDMYRISSCNILQLVSWIPLAMAPIFCIRGLNCCVLILHKIPEYVLRFVTGDTSRLESAHSRQRLPTPSAQTTWLIPKRVQKYQQPCALRVSQQLQAV